MKARREFFCAQLLGVFWFIVGVVGGLLIGIYVYHGGPNGEVTCKNLPESKIQKALTTEMLVPTTVTTEIPVSTTVTTEMPVSTTVTTEMQAATTPPTWTPSTSPDTTESENFTYTIQNEIHEPYFHESIKLPIRSGAPLVHYMQEACMIAPERFTGFTVTYYPQYPGGAGFFIDSINGLSEDWEKTQVYWKISNQYDDLYVGISSYEPIAGDEILFILTQLI